MGIKATPEVKYALIHEAIHQVSSELNVSELCQIAGVSRSGYYAWIKAAPLRVEREEADKRDFALISLAYHARGYPKGGRQIYMWFLHQEPPIIMNLKKIYRLMNKYNLSCPVRRENPYRRMSKAMKTSHVAPNVVARNFSCYPPRQVVLTDITYLFYKENVCYLSTILDVCTHEVLAYKLSRNLQVDFVIDTVNELIRKHNVVLDDSLIVHSDQGCHYTSNAFIAKLRDANFVQSMSRKGNCWDNAPQESFFGHMKDEISSIVIEQTSYEEVEKIVTDWMDYYNNDRYQWDLRKLSPVEFYQYRLSGVYPLQERAKFSNGYTACREDPTMETWSDKENVSSHT